MILGLGGKASSDHLNRTIVSNLRMVGAIGDGAIWAWSAVRPFPLLAHDLLLAGVGGRADISRPDPGVHEFEQRPHVRQASGDDSDGGLNACPHA